MTRLFQLAASWAQALRAQAGTCPYAGTNFLTPPGRQIPPARREPGTHPFARGTDLPGQPRPRR